MGTSSTTRLRSEHPTSQTASTEYFSIDVEDVPAAGLRPGPVLDPRPQERVPQHTVEHEDAICPFVQILDAPVPQTGEELVHFFRSLDTQLPVEQVIDVPKISDDSIQPRLVDRDLRFPQTVEQLVEVPTILSFASLPADRLSSIQSTFQFRVVVGAQVVEVVQMIEGNGVSVQARS